MGKQRNQVYQEMLVGVHYFSYKAGKPWLMIAKGLRQWGHKHHMKDD